MAELKNNLDLRCYIKEKGVKFWEIAERVGLNDGNFSRLLRHELSLEKKTELKAIVDKIVSERS